MPRFRTLLAGALLACAAPLAFAQQPLQQEMTAEEFAAAGLDKLSAAELDVLNRWLQRQVEEETSVVVEQAREEGRQQAQVEAAGRNDGGLFGSSGPREEFQSSIVGEFSGFGRGQRYTLANGQVWEQIDASTLAGVRKTDPQVTVSPGMLGAWFLRIDGYNTRAKVRRVN
ncbi:hypothetical protein ACOPJQ_00975 [Luteimonas dalianensis]|uniref:hypothetical protein n=1 Tax=Luteimonas dalianensis TaxID=1148196 RepID=UPI003BF25B1F